MLDFDLIDLIIDADQEEDLWEPEPLYIDLECPFYDENTEEDPEEDRRVIIIDI